MGCNKEDVVVNDGVVLSQEQREALAIIEDDTYPVVILTGQAGAGKTTVMNALRAKGYPRALFTATTARAALHLNGCTVDTAFCLSREDWTIWNQGLLKRYMEDAPQIVVIDEGSMIGYNMGNLIDEIRKKFEKRIIIVGDFAQAAPVRDSWITESSLLDDVRFIKLVENHRQAERYLCDQLNKMRVGEVDDDVKDMMRARTCAIPSYREKATVLFFTNRTTEDYNASSLQHHVDDSGFAPFELVSEFLDLRSPKARNAHPRDDAYIRKALMGTRFAHQSWFAIGSRVVITMNQPRGGFDKAWVNGDTGVLAGIKCAHKSEPVYENDKVAAQLRNGMLPTLVVKLDRGGKLVEIPPIEATMKDPMGRETHRITGIPVNLGYAMTVHKAQGMTCPRVWVDFKSLGHFPDVTSRHGLAYVAASRVQTLDGLGVGGFDPSLVYCDPHIRRLV